MIKGQRILALIPARGGSKRLPGKNILNFSGKPLIAWSIEAALKSKYIDRVVVSTDDNEIAEVGRKYGANVPFIRPKKIASDEATTIDVALHAINALKNMGQVYELIILLQPTSPLRVTEDIDRLIELSIESKSDCVVSVCEAEHNPLWCNTLPASKSLSGFLEEKIINKRSQDLDKYYRLNGSMYLCNINRLVSENTFFLKDKIIAYEMSQESSVDIDTRLDFIYAAAVYDYISHQKLDDDHI